MNWYRVYKSQEEGYILTDIPQRKVLAGTKFWTCEPSNPDPLWFAVVPSLQDLAIFVAPESPIVTRVNKYFVATFRDAIYRWDPTEDTEEKLNETLLYGKFEPKGKVGCLQALFALMQFSQRKWVAFFSRVFTRRRKLGYRAWVFAI